MNTKEIYMERYKKHMKITLTEFYETVKEAHRKGNNFKYIDNGYKFIDDFINDIYEEGIKDGKLMKKLNIK